MLKKIISNNEIRLSLYWCTNSKTFICFGIWKAWFTFCINKVSLKIKSFNSKMRFHLFLISTTNNVLNFQCGEILKKLVRDNLFMIYLAMTTLDTFKHPHLMEVEHIILIFRIVVTFSLWDILYDSPKMYESKHISKNYEELFAQFLNKNTFQQKVNLSNLGFISFHLKIN